MSKEDVIDYVMTTPSNPNKAVLSGMLDSIGGEGGGSSRVLLYENDAVAFTSGGNWHYAMGGMLDSNSLNACFKPSDGDYTLIIDNEEYTSTLIQDSDAYYMGVKNPGDSEHVGVNKIGVVFNAATFNSVPYVVTLSMLLISSTNFSAGTHSVEIYKEI